MDKIYIEVSVLDKWIYVTEEDVWIRCDAGGYVKGRGNDMQDPEIADYMTAKYLEDRYEDEWAKEAEEYIKKSKHPDELLRDMCAISGNNRAKERLEESRKGREMAKQMAEEAKRMLLQKEKVKRKPKGKRKHTLSPDVKAEVLKRDGYACRECGSEKNLNIHHIKYRSKGGSDSLDNLITLCELCHYEVHKNEPVGKIMRKRILKAH